MIIVTDDVLKLGARRYIGNITLSLPYAENGKAAYKD
jgi:hypothetical protein